MNNHFTSLEIQLIRSSLSTKTDDEIAELLEKPVEEVINKINEITGNGAHERNIRILEVRAILKKQQEEKNNLRLKKEADRLKRQQAARERHSMKKDREEKEFSKRTTFEAQMSEHHRRRATREASQTYKTREVDWSIMKSVRVSRNTLVVVPKEMTEEEAIEQYYKNRDASKRSLFEKDLHQKMKPITN